MAQQIQTRRDTADNWTSVNPILAQGEWGLELDTYPYKQKLGDGVTAWNSLDYFSSGGTGSVESVSGLDTDNSDPANPIVKIAVDGTTVTGTGTAEDPLVSHANGVTSFNDLDDVPNGYTGYGGCIVAVKSTEDGLEFVAPGGGGGTFLWDNIDCTTSCEFYLTPKDYSDGCATNWDRGVRIIEAHNPVWYELFGNEHLTGIGQEACRGVFALRDTYYYDMCNPTADLVYADFWYRADVCYAKDTIRQDGDYLRYDALTNTWRASAGGGGGCSYMFPYSVASDGCSIYLVNDMTCVPADYYYGTDCTGALGWHPLPCGGGCCGSAGVSVYIDDCYQGFYDSIFFYQYGGGYYGNHIYDNQGCGGDTYYNTYYNYSAGNYNDLQLSDGMGNFMSLAPCNGYLYFDGSNYSWGFPCGGGGSASYGSQNWIQMADGYGAFLGYQSWQYDGCSGILTFASTDLARWFNLNEYNGEWVYNSQNNMCSCSNDWSWWIDSAEKFRIGQAVITTNVLLNICAGLCVGGTAPATDGTYSNPTSITIQCGIITAIS